MGLFSSFKEKIKRSAEREVFIAAYKQVQQQGVKIPGDIIDLVDGQLKGLFYLEPEWLNTKLYPKTPREEFVVLGALMTGLEALDKDHPGFEANLATYILMVQLIATRSLGEYSLIEVKLINDSLEYLKELVPRKNLNSEFLDVVAKLEEDICKPK